jgi:hypothetical protein
MNKMVSSHTGSEHFTASEDGNRLDFTISVTDPATFTEPVTLKKYWTYRPGEKIQPFNCTLINAPS